MAETQNTERPAQDVFAVTDDAVMAERQRCAEIASREAMRRFDNEDGYPAARVHDFLVVAKAIEREIRKGAAPTETSPPSQDQAHGISRELMGKIVDDVFDGAIEDARVIEEIYAVIKTHEMTTPNEPFAYAHPNGAIWRADNYPAGMDFAEDGWFALYRFRSPQAAEGAVHLRDALRELNDALDDGLCNSGTPGFDGDRLGRAQKAAVAVLAEEGRS